MSGGGWRERAEAALGSRGGGWLLLGLLTVGYLAAYGMHPLCPESGDGATGGWWTWTDQQRYWREADAIARGALGRDTYFYPVGYSALGALFVRWLPAHAFLVPDLLLVLAASAAWWRIARRWLGAVETAAVAALFVVFHRAVLADTVVVPWNTIATQAALLAGVAAALEPRGARTVQTLALLAAATYLVRPIDAVAFGPLLAFAVLRVDPWRRRIASAAAGLAIVGVAVAGVVALNLAVFGQARTPYEMASAQTVGFFGYPVSWKFFWLFADLRPFFGEAEAGLVWRFPWLWLALPGAVWLVRRERVAGVAVLAAVATSVLLYVNYNDLLPSDLYRFNLIHYLVWWWPLLFAAAAAAVLKGWRTGVVRAAGALALAGAVVVGGLRLELRAVPVRAVGENVWLLPAERPLRVRFAGVRAEAVGRLRIDGRPLVEYSHYLTPLAPPDLQVLLGSKARGERLALEPRENGGSSATTPEIGVYRWSWRVTPSWWRRVFPRPEK